MLRLCLSVIALLAAGIATAQEVQPPIREVACVAVVSNAPANRRPVGASHTARLEALDQAIAHCAIGEPVHFTLITASRPAFSMPLVATLICDFRNPVIVQPDAVACVYVGRRQFGAAPTR